MIAALTIFNTLLLALLILQVAQINRALRTLCTSQEAIGTQLKSLTDALFELTAASIGVAKQTQAALEMAALEANKSYTRN